MLDQTDDYIIQNQDIDSWVTIMFDQPLNLLPGPYGISIGGYAHPLDTFGISVSGDSEVLMSRIQDNGCSLGSQSFGYWYWIRDLPMVRMNFGSPALPSGINESNSLSDMYIYPNPTNGKITIEMNNLEDDIFHFSITNSIGQIVYQKKEKLNETYKSTFNLSTLEKGIYILNINNSSTNIVRQIVIE